MAGTFWGRIKSYLTNLRKSRVPVNEKANKISGAEVKQSPGLDCPQCRFRIQVSILMLLSGEPVLCPYCGLKLSIDKETSKACLDELRKLYNAVQEAKEVKGGYSGAD